MEPKGSSSMGCFSLAARRASCHGKTEIWRRRGGCSMSESPGPRRGFSSRGWAIGVFFWPACCPMTTVYGKQWDSAGSVRRLHMHSSQSQYWMRQTTSLPLAAATQSRSPLETLPGRSTFPNGDESHPALRKVHRLWEAIVSVMALLASFQPLRAAACRTKHLQQGRQSLYKQGAVLRPALPSAQLLMQLILRPPLVRFGLLFATNSAPAMDLISSPHRVVPLGT
mmetsp:Transcript_9570/g.27388  ORF Transcript_9570/g.27388 Transcript_9570/m.27388 type:complete len:225 (+) Transcript_9570:1194-1868(+)